MKRILLTLAALSFCLAGYAQEKKKLSIKKPKFSLGEKMGNIAGNLMTSKTSDLSQTAPVASLVVGVYNTETKTSEVDYFPEGTNEGDHLMFVTFFKNEGVGLYKVEGDISTDGTHMEYLGLGTYGLRFDEPVTSNQIITIKTETGDEATIEIEPIPEIEIIEVNGDPTLPIIDLTEDLRIKFTHPPGSEGTVVKVGLLTDIMGARAWNYFADFKSTDKEVLIPKEAFSNLEINGQLNAGQVNKGMTYLTVTRERIVEPSNQKEGQVTGNCASVKLQTTAYGSKPVIVKGKQEEGVITQLKFSGRHKKLYSYSIYKPNARDGIPFSRGSNFGLASLSINGRTYKKDVESGSSSYTMGGTRYTHTWTTTTTYEFPQLPDSYWDNAMDRFYKEFVKVFNEEFNIQYVDVATVIATPQYAETFGNAEYNTDKGIQKTYKGTRRVSPSSLNEIFSTLSSSQSGDTKTAMMMKAAGIDGLVSLEINFDIGANRDNKVILMPTVNFTVQGMDETKGNREGMYAQGRLTINEGVPFSSEALKNNPDYLIDILNMPSLIETLAYMLENLRLKEVEMGYDKIWSIGEE